MLISRDKEKKTLLEALQAEDSQFIAVYGRRRVGKDNKITIAVEDHPRRHSFFLQMLEAGGEDAHWIGGRKQRVVQFDCDKKEPADAGSG